MDLYFQTTKNLKKNIFLKAGKFIEQRGPDQKKYLETSFFKSFHTRLKIQDLNSKFSNLPMCDKQKDFLFFNGEIYNFKKLQIDLISKNVEINSSGDSEILFKYLIKFGIKKL